MSPVSRQQFDQIQSEIHDVLGESVSKMFLGRVDALLEEWIAGKYTAAQVCEKVQKLVSLFIDKDKARRIGSRFTPIIARETTLGKK